MEFDDGNDDKTPIIASSAWVNNNCVTNIPLRTR